MLVSDAMLPSHARVPEQAKVLVEMHDPLPNAKMTSKLTMPNHIFIPIQ
jgi:hypothetical protein